MGSLSDRIYSNLPGTTQKRDQYGNLIEEVRPGTPEGGPRGSVVPTQQLAAAGGLPASPTTPQGVTAIGGNPDQAKMAGTAGQKEAALGQSVGAQPRLTLQQAEARQQDQTQQTAQQQDVTARAAKLKPIASDAFAKAQGLVDAEMKKLATAGQAAAPTVLTSPTDLSTLAAPGATPDNAAVQKALSAKDATALMSALGYTEATLTPEAWKGIDNAIATAADAQSKEGAGAAFAKSLVDADKTGISALLPGLMPGSKNPAADLAVLLGVPVAQISTMSLAQLDDAVRNVENQAGLTTGQLNSMIASAPLGAAERGAVAQASRNLATTGFAGTESELEKMAANLRNGKVHLLGKDFDSLEAALSDKGITDIITGIVNNPDTPESKKLLAENPEVQKFLDSYKGVLAAAVKEIETTGKAVVESAGANRALATYGGNTLPDSVMKQVYTDWGGKLTGKKLAPTGVIKALQGIPKEQQGPLALAIKELATTGPSGFSKEIAGISDPKKLAALFAGPSDRRPIDVYVNANKELEGLAASKGNMDDLIQYAFKDALNAGDINRILKDQEASQALGLSKMDPLLASLDKDKDGKLDKDAASTLYSSATSALKGSNTLQGALSGNARTDKQQHIIKPEVDVTDEQRVLAEQLGPDIQKKGLVPVLQETIDTVNLPADPGDFILHMPQSILDMLGTAPDATLLTGLTQTVDNTGTKLPDDVQSFFDYAKQVSVAQQSLKNTGVPDQAAMNTLMNIILGGDQGRDWQDAQAEAKQRYDANQIAEAKARGDLDIKAPKVRM